MNVWSDSRLWASPSKLFLLDDMNQALQPQTEEVARVRPGLRLRQERWT